MHLKKKLQKTFKGGAEEKKQWEGEEYLRNWKSAKQQMSNKHVLEKQEEQHK